MTTATTMTSMTMASAINLALGEILSENNKALIIGWDIASHGGTFGVTQGLLEKWSPDRVVDFPVSGSAMIGMAMGLCCTGYTPICELQHADLVGKAWHQMTNHVARWRERTRGRWAASLVVRIPCGANPSNLENDGNSRESPWVAIPGLKVVMPSGPRNARSLLRAAVRDPDPVVFCEPRSCYKGDEEAVPNEPEMAELGKAAIARPGRDVTVISYGATVRSALLAADELADKHHIDAEVIDLRSLLPLDTDTIDGSVQKTGRCVVVHESPRTYGPAAEVAAGIAESSMMYLEAPIRRVTGYDLVVPRSLQDGPYVPDVLSIVAAAQDLAGYRWLPRWHAAQQSGAPARHRYPPTNPVE